MKLHDIFNSVEYMVKS